MPAVNCTVTATDVPLANGQRQPAGTPPDCGERDCANPRVGFFTPSPLGGEGLGGRRRPQTKHFPPPRPSPTRGERKDRSGVSPPPRPNQEGLPQPAGR